MYSPLLRHTLAESLRRYMINESTYLEMVGVQYTQPQAGSTAPGSSSSSGSSSPVVNKRVYLWVVGRQPEGGEVPGAWMTQVGHTLSVCCRVVRVAVWLHSVHLTAAPHPYDRPT